jgi:hypothetical protein
VESFEAQTLINARNSTVWDIITDAGNYSVWGSGITHIDGDVRNGALIRIRTALGGKRTIRLRVRQIPGEVMTWTGALPLGLGLVSGIRTFTLTPEAGRTLLRVKDDFSGPLHGLFSRTRPVMGSPVDDYVTAVRERAELLG